MRLSSVCILLLLSIVKSIRGNCEECSPGRFCVFQTDKCEVCPTGKYTFANDTRFCHVCQNMTDCPPIKYCQAGKYFDYNTGLCNDCAIGLFRKTQSENRCISCPPGKYNIRVAQQECIGSPCPVGSVAPVNSPRCSLCLPGQYSNKIWAKTCKVCPKGYFSTQYGSSRCIQALCNTSEAPFLSHINNTSTQPTCLSCSEDRNTQYLSKWCVIYICFQLLYQLFTLLKFGISDSCAHFWIPGACFHYETDEENTVSNEWDSCFLCSTRFLNICIWRVWGLFISAAYIVCVHVWCSFTIYLRYPLLFFTFLSSFTTLWQMYQHFVFNKIVPIDTT
jgi:hypothetical protein